MERFETCWLVVNPASGSNTEESCSSVKAALERRGIAVERVVTFPDEPLPDASKLNADNIPLVVVFTGDGTVNALVNHLSGWGGAVLVLPGGTMNLLAKRLHIAEEVDAIIDVVAHGVSLRRRPTCVRCPAGVALAGLLVGPGTYWGKVREAMRDGAIGEMASEAMEAIRETANGPPILLADNPIAREHGYPLVELTPGEHGIQIDGFYAEEALDYAGQAWALLRRQFRDGPHDRLGLAESFTLTIADGSILPCLVDGEPAECQSGAQFTVEPCGVDLLATGHGI